MLFRSILIGHPAFPASDPDALAVYDFEDSPSSANQYLTNKAYSAKRAEDYDLKFGYSLGKPFGIAPSWQTTGSNSPVSNANPLRFGTKQALLFNGGTDAAGTVIGTTTPVPNLQKGSYSVACWVRADNFNTITQRYFFSQNSQSGLTVTQYPGFQFYNNGATRLFQENQNAGSNPNCTEIGRAHV